MNDRNIIEKEWQMVKEYQRKQNENIALYFYNKYSDNVCNIVFSKINCKFSSVPLERNDLLSFVWKGIKNTLNKVNIENKSKLIACFVKQSYYCSLREALRFLTNGHIILNNASSLEEMTSKKVYIKSKNGVIYQELKYQYLKDELIRRISIRLHSFDQKIIQRIIYLKSIGYSIKDISKKLNLPLKTIREVSEVIVKIGKLIYKN